MTAEPPTVFCLDKPTPTSLVPLFCVFLSVCLSLSSPLSLPGFFCILSYLLGQGR